MKIGRRLDTSGRCLNEQNCPGVFLTSDSNVAFIGADPSSEVQNEVLAGAEMPDGMELVVIPRDVLINAGWTPPEI